MNKFFAVVLWVAVVMGTAYTETNYNTTDAGWYLNASMGVTVNPLGLALDTKIYNRIPLLNKPGMLWKTTKLDWGLKNRISPALEYIGAIVTIEPIAVFQLTAEVGLVRLFPLFGYGLLSFNSITDDYSSDTRETITATNGVAHNDLLASLQPSFRVAFGPVAIVHNITWQYRDYGTNAIMYDYMIDTLRLGYDSYIKHDTMVIIKKGDFRYGVVHHWGYMYGTALKDQRVMAMGIWTPKVEDINPYFILQAGYNLQQHEYRDQLYIAVQVGANFKLTK